MATCGSSDSVTTYRGPHALADPAGVDPLADGVDRPGAVLPDCEPARAGRARPRGRRAPRRQLGLKKLPSLSRTRAAIEAEPERLRVRAWMRREQHGGGEVVESHRRECTHARGHPGSHVVKQGTDLAWADARYEQGPGAIPQDVRQRLGIEPEAKCCFPGSGSSHPADPGHPAGRRPR